MFKFILKRIGYGIFTAFIVITITFFLIHLKPGEPISAGAKKLTGQAKINFEEKHGLNLPLAQQYTRYLKKLVLHFDFGESMVNNGQGITETIFKHGPISATYGSIAIVLELIFGLSLGILAAFKRGTWIDNAVGILIIIGVCVPGFVMGSLLQYVVCMKLKWVPVFAWGTPGGIILPAVAVALSGTASYCKFMRNSTLSVIGEDYIVTAKAKGVSKLALVWKHVIRNAIIPIITFVAPAVMNVFVGGLVIEKIFSVPGLGDNFVTAINSNDYTMIMGLTIFSSIAYIIALILVDIFYSLADPRIRIGNESR